MLSQSRFSNLGFRIIRSTRAGYTLVELLIVITISTLLVTIGVSAYRKATDIQTTKNATETVLTTLTAAQKAATSGKIDCTGPYLGEIVTTTASSPTLTLTSSCEGNNGIPRSVSLVGYNFQANTTLVFRPLNQGVNTGVSDSLDLDYAGPGGTYRIQVTKGGTIKSVGKISQ